MVYIVAGQQTGSWVIGFFFGTFFLVNFVAFFTNKLGFFFTIVNLCKFGNFFDFFEFFFYITKVKR